MPRAVASALGAFGPHAGVRRSSVGVVQVVRYCDWGGYQASAVARTGAEVSIGTPGLVDVETPAERR